MIDPGVLSAFAPMLQWSITAGHAHPTQPAAAAHAPTGGRRRLFPRRGNLGALKQRQIGCGCNFEKLRETENRLRRLGVGFRSLDEG